jgi:hypothetical protein
MKDQAKHALSLSPTNVGERVRVRGFLRDANAEY